MASIRWLVVVAVLAAGLASGCGTDFTQELPLPDRLYGAEGQVFFLEDLEEIANDSGLTDAAKRQAFQDLGIEDPDLIDALLTL